MLPRPAGRREGAQVPALLSGRQTDRTADPLARRNAGEVAKRLPELEGLLPEARELDLHYIPSRYPNGLPSGYPHAVYGREIAEGAGAAADRILGAVTRRYHDAGDQDLLTGSDS